MKHSKLVLVAVVLGAAAVCWGGTASLAGFRLGEVIDVSSAAVLKERGLAVDGPVCYAPDVQPYYFGYVTKPTNDFISVYVYMSTNREIVRVSADVKCKSGETAEELRAKWLERYKDSLVSDGPTVLMFDTWPSSPTNKYDDILLVEITSADALRNKLFRYPVLPPAK